MTFISAAQLKETQDIQALIAENPKILDDDLVPLSQTKSSSSMFPTLKYLNEIGDEEYYHDEHNVINEGTETRKTKRGKEEDSVFRTPKRCKGDSINAKSGKVEPSRRKKRVPHKITFSNLPPVEGKDTDMYGGTWVKKRDLEIPMVEEYDGTPPVDDQTYDYQMEINRLSYNETKMRKRISKHKDAVADKDIQISILRVALNELQARNKDQEVRLRTNDEVMRKTVDSISQLRNKIKDTLSCCVCTELMMEPIVLGCSHNICLGCFEQMWHHHKGKSSKLGCPTCRHPLRKKVVTSLTLRGIVEDVFPERVVRWEERKRKNQFVLSDPPTDLDSDDGMGFYQEFSYVRTD